MKACRADAGFGVPSDMTWRSEVEWLDSKSEAPSMAEVVLPNQEMTVQRVWKSVDPVAYNDCYHDPKLENMREGFRATRLQSMIAKRFEHDGQIFGLICVDQTTHARSWQPADFKFLDRFCSKYLSPLLFRSRCEDTLAKPSPAELEAVRLASKGLSYKQIAKKLGKSVRTIEHQLRSATLKMNAMNQADLVVKCQLWL